MGWFMSGLNRACIPKALEYVPSRHPSSVSLVAGTRGTKATGDRRGATANSAVALM